LIGLLEKHEKHYEFTRKNYNFTFEKLDDLVTKTLNVFQLEVPKHAHSKKFNLRENMTTLIPESVQELCFTFDWRTVGTPFSVDLGVVAYNGFGREVEYLFQDKKKVKSSGFLIFPQVNHLMFYSSSGI
jgi:hypothetical protein